MERKWYGLGSPSVSYAEYNLSRLIRFAGQGREESILLEE